jgi:hypothetical protein
MATLKEREQRQEALGHETDVFLLNEGVCPTCKGDVKIAGLGGVKRFFRDYPFNAEEGCVVNHWDEDAGDYFIIGGISFVCEDGHRHYIEVNKHGDWV